MNRWFVVNTQANVEEKARFHLERQGFHVYLPRYLKRRSHARCINWVPAPMFPRYLFVCLDPETDPWRPIRSTVGVSGLICHGERPAPVPVGIVEDIQARHTDDGLVSLSLGHRFSPGERVRVMHGPMADQVGIFECADDRERVFVLLDVMGRQVKTRLPREAVVAYG